MKSVSRGFFSFLPVEGLTDGHPCSPILKTAAWRLPGSCPSLIPKKLLMPFFQTSPEMLHPSTLLLNTASSLSQSLWLNLK